MNEIKEIVTEQLELLIQASKTEYCKEHPDALCNISETIIHYLSLGVLDNIS